MSKLIRRLPLYAVVAAALCNVIGGGINVLIVEIQKEVPIGPLVPLAVLVGGVIAFLISLVYSSLSTSMPRAGGEYIYISRGLSPLLAFVVAFIKLIGTVIALGTVAYMDANITATAMEFIGFSAGAAFLSTALGKSIFALSIIWVFFLINYFGVKKYANTVTILAILMLIGGLAVIGIGLSHNHEEFSKITGFNLKEGGFNPSITDFVYAVSILFWAYIGFTSIAQSGGEIEEPKKNLPRAFMITTVLVMLYYFFYSYSFYHAVPWEYVASLEKGLNVPNIISIYVPKGVSFLLTLFVFLALANDVPPMLYTKSRLIYGWAKDGIFPPIFFKTNKYHVPHFALALVAGLASLVAIECVMGGFFTEVDVVVVSRFILYALLALTLIIIPKKNPKIYENIAFLKNRVSQVILASVVIVFSIVLFIIMTYIDLTSGKPWWMLSTTQTIAIIILGIVVYFDFIKRMKREGKDYRKIFENLPQG